MAKGKKRNRLSLGVAIIVTRQIDPKTDKPTGVPKVDILEKGHDLQQLHVDVRKTLVTAPNNEQYADREYEMRFLMDTAGLHQGNERLYYAMGCLLNAAFDAGRRFQMTKKAEGVPFLQDESDE